MRFPLTEQLLQEARAFQLRAACRDCFYWNAAKGECWHGWPDEGQRQWPLGGGGGAAAGGGEASAGGDASATAEDGAPAVELRAGSEVAFCKEFELK